MLNLPEGAEAGFHLVATDAFGYRFSMHLYGKRRRGWYLASQRTPGHDLDIGPQALRKGQWRTFLNFVKQARFWELPEQYTPPGNFVVDDGEWLDLTGRVGDQCHRIHRFVWREPGLDQLLTFCRRLSGFFVPHPVYGHLIPNVPSVAEAASPADGSDASSS